MNGIINAGQVFSLKDLVPWQEGRIVNMDILRSGQTKLALMAFDAGTGLSPHAAPGDALIFALEGEGIIGYEGKEHLLRAGENFCFAASGQHWIKAEKPFKTALLLSLAPRSKRRNRYAIPCESKLHRLRSVCRHLPRGLLHKR